MTTCKQCGQNVEAVVENDGVVKAFCNMNPQDFVSASYPFDEELRLAVHEDGAQTVVYLRPLVAREFLTRALAMLPAVEGETAAPKDVPPVVNEVRIESSSFPGQYNVVVCKASGVNRGLRVDYGPKHSLCLNGLDIAGKFSLTTDGARRFAADLVALADSVDAREVVGGA